ncbi:MAG: NAD(P) transhydrogenase subunit alpha [Opitutaceae bacterium]|jgi:NAD(P) transhydrogenase subunit alpha|nr:NAD(P) transhydrogenase subunit alpha [Opitutaceae bacterium]
MKTVFIPCETAAEETRVALVPEDAAKLARLGLRVEVAPGAGLRAGFTDAAYAEAGATVASDAAASLAAADIVLRVLKPDTAAGLKPGALHLSFLNPFAEKQLLADLAAAGVSAVSLELIPRSTLAQKMDVLSSQANLAGYCAVTQAAARLPKIFPLLMTPAGTLSPARVLIIGVGVAGLQAIATARRLGARVEAFDTRPAVEEQVKSLGARFLKIDIGETGQTAQGYARELTPEQVAKQRAGMAKACAQADVVITTAKVFGRPAPRLLTAEMLSGMAPGSLVLDMAVDTGGNVEGSDAAREVVTANGVRVIGCASLERVLARDASRMFSGNLTAFITHFWDAEKKEVRVEPDDPIMGGCLLTRAGAITHPKFRVSHEVEPRRSKV